MIDVEFNWEEGEVGNFWLSVGLIKNTAHVYQTPWTGLIWWVESLVFNIERSGFENIVVAKKAVEQTVEKWFQKATYKPEDTIWMFADNM